MFSPRVRLKKRFSQVLLTDAAVLELITTTLPIRGKTVLEIGPGTGNLTEWLLQAGAKVVAIEKDVEMANALRERFGERPKNLKVVLADALQEDLSAFGARTYFGNLPYNISSPLLLHILESDFDEALLLLQKEFADKLCAPPGSPQHSRLSVAAQNRARVEIALPVNRLSFTPVPRVDSALVYIKRFKRKQRALDDELVNLLYQHKKQDVRKALLSSAHAFGAEKKEWREKIERVLPAELLHRKVFSLSMDELAALTTQVKALAAKKTGKN